MAKNNKAPRGETFVGRRPTVFDDGLDNRFKGGSFTDRDLREYEEELYSDGNEFAEIVDDYVKEHQKEEVKNDMMSFLNKTDEDLLEEELAAEDFYE